MLPALVFTMKNIFHIFLLFFIFENSKQQAFADCEARISFVLSSFNPVDVELSF
jgi:hypothetical protein